MNNSYSTPLSKSISSSGLQSPLPSQDLLLNNSDYINTQDELENEVTEPVCGGLCRVISTLPASARAFLLFIVVGSVVGLFVGLLIIPTQDNTSNTPNTPEGLGGFPIVLNTWFEGSTTTAWYLLSNGSTALDAVEAGCQYCEDNQCDGTVGWGGSPDTTGETTLDALIMDGITLDVGAVSYLRRIRHAISAARKVLHYSSHTILSGDGATNFSIMMGLEEQDSHSQGSIKSYSDWVNASCQPNYFLNVQDQTTSCPPYVPVPTPTYTPVANMHRQNYNKNEKKIPSTRKRPVPASKRDHDTVGMCAIDKAGNIAAGVSSNGANHKIAGRVGDAPIVGAGGYAANDGGCAAATGDGDITMRFLPAYQAVENMRRGMDPTSACTDAVLRIEKYYPKFELGLLCVDKYGRYGAASHGWTFTYCAASNNTTGVTICNQVKPLDG
jgi:N4-(beta-N-acetylglucosaminyl)-L-asparaginase